MTAGAGEHGTGAPGFGPVVGAPVSNATQAALARMEGEVAEVVARFLSALPEEVRGSVVRGRWIVSLSTSPAGPPAVSIALRPVRATYQPPGFPVPSTKPT